MRPDNTGLPPYPPAPSPGSMAAGAVVFRPLTPAMTAAIRARGRRLRGRAVRVVALLALLCVAELAFALLRPQGARDALAMISILVVVFMVVAVLPLLVGLLRDRQEMQRLLAGPCAEYVGPFAVGRGAGRTASLLLPPTPLSPAVRLPVPAAAGRALAALPGGAVTFLPEPPTPLAVRGPGGAFVYTADGYLPDPVERHGDASSRAADPSRR